VSQDATNIYIEITDALGRKIATINEGSKTKGDYYVQWSKTNLAAGAYYARMYVDGVKSMTVGIIKTN
jgi:flagellar hook assembly protein FlgD